MIDTIVHIVIVIIIVHIVIIIIKRCVIIIVVHIRKSLHPVKNQR